MFEKMSLMWVDVSKMDIVLAVMSCFTIAALYAAFLM